METKLWKVKLGYCLSYGGSDYTSDLYVGANSITEAVELSNIIVDKMTNRYDKRIISVIDCGIDVHFQNFP